jgi:hypothetical protein
LQSRFGRFLGTSYIGLPTGAARLVTLGRLRAVRFCVRAHVGARLSISCTRKNRKPRTTNSVPRSAGVLLCWARSELQFTGGGIALARKLYRAATFSYDGTQYKGRIVQPITPNELFYCVTKECGRSASGRRSLAP